jgi:hypothetical protein
MARRGRPTAEVVLTEEEHETLERWARRPKSAQSLCLAVSDRLVVRKREGTTNGEVAARLGVTPQTVGKWRRRFVERRWPSLWSYDPTDARCRNLNTDLEQLSLDPTIAPERVLFRHPPNEELSLQGDGSPRCHPMWPGPLPADELTMPAAERVRGHERRYSLRDRSKSLQHSQHDALFWADLWSVDLTPEHCDLLSKYEDFDVLGPGRAASEEDESEELSAD